MSLVPPHLIAITPGTHGPDNDLLPWLRAMGEAGLPAVILREWQLEAKEYEELAFAATEWIPEVILHSRAPEAVELAISQDFSLHLPGGGIPGALRAKLVRLLGRSCHTREEVDDALRDGADYALLSPVWSPKSKPADKRKPLGARAFLRAAAHRPVLALGGVTAVRAALMRSGGAHGVAVMGSLFGSANPADAAEVVRSLLEAVTPEVEA